MKQAAKNHDKFAVGLVFGLVLANLFVWLAAAQNSQNKYLEASFFDVGQGDAAFIQAPNGIQILIDGGPDSGILEKMGQTMPFYDRDIDWIVLSHPDRDHLAGLLAVLKNYRVHNILWSGIPKKTAESDKWLDMIAKEGSKIVMARAGNLVELGQNPRFALEILAPGESAAKTADDSNEASVVVRVIFGGRYFVFTGDAADGEERVIAASNPNLRADVLKIAHHGSKYSANEGFFEDLLPAAAVISVGAANSYGHPSAEVLEMLAKYDIKILRTDQNGDILFRTDGNQIFLKTQKTKLIETNWKNNGN